MPVLSFVSFDAALKRHSFSPNINIINLSLLLEKKFGSKLPQTRNPMKAAKKQI